MIATYNGRPFEQFKASGYSTDEVEEMITNGRVRIYTDEEAPDTDIRGGAPLGVESEIEEIRDD